MNHETTFTDSGGIQRTIITPDDGTTGSLRVHEAAVSAAKAYWGEQ